MELPVSIGMHSLLLCWWILIILSWIKYTWASVFFTSSFSAERYDPLTSTWTSIAAMSTRRRYVRVATLGRYCKKNQAVLLYLLFTVCILITHIKRELPSQYATANIYILSIYSLFPSRWQLVCGGRLWQLLTSRNSGEIWPPGIQLLNLSIEKLVCCQVYLDWML